MLRPCTSLFIIIIIIYFYQFGTGRRSQKAVKPVRCDYLKPMGELLVTLKGFNKATSFIGPITIYAKAFEAVTFRK